MTQVDGDEAQLVYLRVVFLYGGVYMREGVYGSAVTV